MKRTLFRISHRKFSIDENMNRISRFYYQIKEHPNFTSPKNDYERSLKKINLTIYRLMIQEYEENIKPLIENETRKVMLEKLKSEKGICVEFKEDQGFVSFKRETRNMDFDLRVFRYVEKLAGVVVDEPEDEMKETMRKSKELRKEQSLPDERYFFKVNGKFVETQMLSMNRKLFDKYLDESKKHTNPFLFHDSDSNVLEMRILVKNKITGKLLEIEGRVFDLLVNK